MILESSNSAEVFRCYMIIFIPFYNFRMSSSCIHITALLFRVEAANRSGITNPACTSRQCVWNVPSEKTVIKPTKIADMSWKSSKLNKGNSVRYSKHRT